MVSAVLLEPDGLSHFTKSTHPILTAITSTPTMMTRTDRHDIMITEMLAWVVMGKNILCTGPWIITECGSVLDKYRVLDLTNAHIPVIVTGIPASIIICTWMNIIIDNKAATENLTDTTIIEKIRRNGNWTSQHCPRNVWSFSNSL